MRLGNKAKHHVPFSVVHCGARNICIWKMTFVARRCWGVDQAISGFHINCCKRTHLFHGGPWTLEATPSRHLNVQHAEDSLELFLYLDTRRPWPMVTELHISLHWGSPKILRLRWLQTQPTTQSPFLSQEMHGLHRRTWGFHGHWNVLWRGCLVIKSANLPRLRFPHEGKDAK